MGNAMAKRDQRNAVEFMYKQGRGEWDGYKVDPDGTGKIKGAGEDIYLYRPNDLNGSKLLSVKDKSGGKFFQFAKDMNENMKDWYNFNDKWKTAFEDNAELSGNFSADEKAKLRESMWNAVQNEMFTDSGLKGAMEQQAGADKKKKDDQKILDDAKLKAEWKDEEGLRLRRMDANSIAALQNAQRAVGGQPIPTSAVVSTTPPSTTVVK